MQKARWRVYFADGTTADDWLESPGEGVLLVQITADEHPLLRWWVHGVDYYTYRPDLGDRWPWGFDDLTAHKLWRPTPTPAYMAGLKRGVWVPEHIWAETTGKAHNDPDFPKGRSWRRRANDMVPLPDQDGGEGAYGGAGAASIGG